MTATTTATVQTVVRRRHEGLGTALAGTAYPDLVVLVERMRRADPRIVFDSLRPLGDEFWNTIDGKRTAGEIAEAVCLEFGFELPPELFLPLVEGLIASGAVEVVPTREGRGG